MKRCRADQLASYLDEFLCQGWYGTSGRKLGITLSVTYPCNTQFSADLSLHTSWPPVHFMYPSSLSISIRTEIDSCCLLTELYVALDVWITAELVTCFFIAEVHLGSEYTSECNPAHHTHVVPGTIMCVSFFFHFMLNFSAHSVLYGVYSFVTVCFIPGSTDFSELCSPASLYTSMWQVYYYSCFLSQTF